MTSKETANIPVTDVPTCSICSSADRKLIASGHDYEYETCDNLWTMWQCAKCSHVQLCPRPADSALDLIYPKNYYSYNINRQVSSFALLCKKAMDEFKFRKILSLIKSSPKSYLDIGCGDGRYLKLMSEKGVLKSNAHGIELDATAVKSAQAQGLNVHQCKIEDADHIQAGTIDLVTMFHVIEHVSDPNAVVSKIHKLLTGGGALIIETPNHESLDAGIFRERYWGGYHFPRHWHIFTPRSMKDLLDRNGFRIHHLSFQPGHAFWLFSIHHVIKYKWKMPRLAACFHPLKSIPGLIIVVGFDMIRMLIGLKTSAMLIVALKKHQ